MEIVSGLDAGERVLLNPPRYDPNGKSLDVAEEEEPPTEEEQEPPAAEPEAEQQPEEPPDEEEKSPRMDPQQMLERLPADVRERWEGMSQEERRAAMQRLRQPQTQPQPQPQEQ